MLEKIPHWQNMKLTKPQLELLKTLEQEGPIFVADYYPPARKLVELGLAEFKSSCLSITESGRQILLGGVDFQP
jgi:hypothetical protein